MAVLDPARPIASDEVSMQTSDRRAFLLFTSASALLAACVGEHAHPTSPERGEKVKEDAGDGKEHDKEEEKEVAANEDLMREHGVIRRVLVVYGETAARLRTKPDGVDLAELKKAAELMRTFAEDYHEKKLEETHLFPAVQRAGGPAAKEIDTLLAQHKRGREITDYVIAATARPLGADSANDLARTLDGFVRMYSEHAAREDTIVFPAWKDSLSEKQYDEMGELFEKIEHDTFGHDGFDDAVERIAAIERAIGLEPALLTAPPPPKLA
jgi:hemerythrin-like domain-containing protein